MPMNYLLKELVTAYKNPQPEDEDRNGNTRLAVLRERFHLSPLRLQKLLVTAGVYEPVKDSSMYSVITRLYKAGKSVKEIMEQTGLSNAAVSACLPYERVVYNADLLGVELSDAARRKRRQRSREEMIKQNVRNLLQFAATDETFWAALQEHAWEKFISTDGERFTYHMLTDRPPRKAGEKVISVVDYKQGLLPFTYQEVTDVLHEALELKAVGTTAVSSFKQTAALPYLYPLLVYFGILPGNKKEYAVRHAMPVPEVCSCCGCKAEYTVRSYADLCFIAKAMEEEERNRWTPEERERCEREEAALGCQTWEERAYKSNAAIRAFDAEGERHFCRLCAQTIRMALEDGELPNSAAPENLEELSLPMAYDALQGNRLAFPKGVRFADRYDRVYPEWLHACDEDGQEEEQARHGEYGQPFLYRVRDKAGVEHTFACYMQQLPRHAVFEACEVHRLTRTGRLVRYENTGTFYEFRTGMRHTGWQEEAENRRQICIGFLELINKIRDALRNPSLDWHVGTSHVSNMLEVEEEQELLQGASLEGNAARSRRSKKTKSAYRQCYLRSSGEMKVEDDGFLIDGRVFHGEELVRLAGVHEGWTLQYRFTDPADPPLRAGEYLMPVQLNERQLVSDTVELLNMFSRDGRFVSDRDEDNFGKLFEKLVLPKLKLYHESNPRGYGRLAGMQVIRRLQWVEGTEWQQGQVREVIGK